MAKRSPILGYNHNVRYRGLVFHVQTEDSGVLSPHLFTHLFHSGVIVSTRKLVYDSGSDEGAIKALMQAQHKAVLKELKRGLFDDKIDQYLGGTPGLLPRGVAEDAADSERSASDASSDAGIVPMPPVLPAGHVADAEINAPLTDAELQISREPTIEDPAIGLRPTMPSMERVPTPRSQTDRPAYANGADSTADVTLRTELIEPEVVRSQESQPEILIQLEIDDSDQHSAPRTRASRDTDVAALREQLDDHTRPTVDVSHFSDGIPGSLLGGPTLRTGDAPTSPVPDRGTGPLPPLPPLERRPSTAVGAASLPPARPIARPPSRPSIVPPTVVSRPLPVDDRRSQNTDAIEVYAPPPPSVDPPPGMAQERPGQYSQHKKVGVRTGPTDVVREGARPVPPIPPVQARPATARPVPPAAPGAPARAPSEIRAERPSSPELRAGPAERPSSSELRAPDLRAVPQSVPPVRHVTSPIGSGSEKPRAAPRVASETPPASAVPPPPPTVSRTASVVTNNSNNNSGVVMTRPAVIVGAPTRPAPQTQVRVRKAREDEGRGFGQGLISEKSLDEVILAYLSEDAEDK